MDYQVIDDPEAEADAVINAAILKSVETRLSHRVAIDACNDAVGLRAAIDSEAEVDGELERLLDEYHGVVDKADAKIGRLSGRLNRSLAVDYITKAERDILKQNLETYEREHISLTTLLALALDGDTDESVDELGLRLLEVDAQLRSMYARLSPAATAAPAAPPEVPAGP